jgi:hypothetical protein
MSSITLTAGVRQNLLSLQQTADLLTTTQNRLATGKKVNSAFDNPSSYFASQSLSNRASDLSTLLDQIGQAQQTLNAANQGLTSLTSLLQSALSTAKQAQSAAEPALGLDTGTLSGATTVGTAAAGNLVVAVTGGSSYIELQRYFGPRLHRRHHGHDRQHGPSPTGGEPDKQLYGQC